MSAVCPNDRGRWRAVQAFKEESLPARVLGVSRQGYYARAARQQRGPLARARRDAELTEQIRRPRRASDEIYGAPRIHADLRELDGVRGGCKRVARLMLRRFGHRDGRRSTGAKSGSGSGG
ncbi:IS3 family transposase [Nonomuraea muscovyensis]|uniref:IS3 family transposase n=1 Tax=Nonomuraea muscovyensis TaxID=1124761 RepID=UPI00161C8662